MDLTELHKISVKAVYEHFALQKPDELTFILSLIEPDDIIVEIGCDAGGMGWAISQIPHRAYFGIDLPGEKFSSGLAWQGEEQQMIFGDSHKPDTKSKLLKYLGYNAPSVIIIDGDHTYAGVADDFRMYGKLSTGLVFFHDICQHQEIPTCKVDQFWNDIKPRYTTAEYISPNDSTWGGVGVIDFSYSGRLKNALQQVQGQTA